ncbi:hypothetical protein PDESU_04302 [Pontiella desulfatans]|uniref:Winged helix-turn helix domain-containing protein n=1 Tax=Pontiella desulfatans TaxID=2750659 RepID=A0A6C2U7E0_PONDE|nr:helix-turn-helix domain-containing protein [Pontiella desulfatans]VGO15717.1 hypothetical protein PDESU_04302 [Pontiella desulfatans]
MRPKLKITSSTYSREDLLDHIDDAHFQKNWKVKRRYQVILFALSGKYTTDEIAELVGCSRASVTNWVKRWREGGPFALGSNRYKPTRAPALTEEMVVDLVEHLTAGLISGGKGHESIQVWLKERYDLDLAITAVDYWYSKIWDRFCKGELQDCDASPKNPLEVDLGNRQRLEDREKKRTERDRRRRQLGLVACA